MTDYERGVEQASAIYKEVIREYVAENAKLRKYVAWLEKWALDHASFGLSAEVQFELDMARRELGVEVDG